MTWTNEVPAADGGRRGSGPQFLCRRAAVVAGERPNFAAVADGVAGRCLKLSPEPRGTDENIHRILSFLDMKYVI
ncbi:hypothetical protein OSB04_un000519 [Centaurea solstitialis]|uniref:Uncharacterized protein n=1 Tax=Centaurea solstitialis TaxID=347529 RepID=A0AA38S4Y1_9ASTR|nr:hypothetical protein OSB04_un000519 [Centaurea solstitialis]